MAESIIIDGDHPWPWLDAYTAAAAAFFNGRDEDTARLLACVLAAPATVFFGKSGLGKTSLVQAGLGHRLRQKRLFPVMVRTRGIEASGLSRTLLDALLASAQSADLIWVGRPLVSDDPRSPTAQLWELLHESEGTFRGPEGARWTPVFVLDQFEEVFTLITEAARRKALFDELGDLIEGRVPPEVARRLQDDETLIDRIDPDRIGARFVLSLREDFLPDLETWADRIPRLGPNRCRLLPMTQSQALGAVTQTGGSLVQAGDARRIVDFLGHQGEGADLAHRPQAAAHSVEPALLSLVCAGLNQDRLSQTPPGVRLDTRDLAARGGRLLETFYDDGISALPVERRELAQGLIERELITSSGTRRPFPRRDIGKAGLSDADLALLTDKRLLRIENTEQGDYIELVHDRVAEVAALRAAQSRERVERAAREAVLLEEARRTRQRRNLYGWVAAIVMAVTLAGLGAVLYQWRDAVASRQAALRAQAEALAAKDQAESAQADADRDRKNALLAKSEAVAAKDAAQRAETDAKQDRSAAVAAKDQAQGARVEAERGRKDALLAKENALMLARESTALRLVGDGVDMLEARRLGGTLKGALTLLAGHRLAQASKSYAQARAYGALQREAANEHSLVWLRELAHPVVAVAFSPDGARIVSGSKDDTLRLWHAGTGEPIGAAPRIGGLKGYNNSSVAFSPSLVQRGVSLNGARVSNEE